MPRWYAPMFHIPMSSPMMNRIFGFLPFCWATADRSAAESSMSAASSIDTGLSLRFFIDLLLACIRWCQSRRPVQALVDEAYMDHITEGSYWPRRDPPSAFLAVASC